MHVNKLALIRGAHEIGFAVARERGARGITACPGARDATRTLVDGAAVEAVSGVSRDPAGRAMAAARLSGRAP